jgi:hypothetical protein
MELWMLPKFFKDDLKTHAGRLLFPQDRKFAEPARPGSRYWVCYMFAEAL